MKLAERTDAAGRPSYRAQVKTKDADGRWTTVYGSWTRSIKAAEREQRDLLARRDRGTLAPAHGATVASYLRDDWIPDVTKIAATEAPLAPNTARKYRDQARKIIDEIGTVRLVDLRPRHVRRLRDALLDDYGLAPQTVESYLRMLSQALSKAQVQGMIGSNPAAANVVTRPHGEPEDIPIIEPADARKILAACTGRDPWDAAAHLALGASLRRGEVLGLRWDLVDLDRGLLLVGRAYSENGTWKPPKTKNSVREIELPSFVVAALRRHKAAQAERRLLVGEGWGFAVEKTHGSIDMDPGEFVTDLVVDRGLGEPWDPATFSTYWSRFATAEKFPAGLSFHGLRHGTGALLLDAGIDDAVALAIMGHSAVAMLRHYQGVSSALKRRAADRLDEILGG